MGFTVKEMLLKEKKWNGILGVKIERFEYEISVKVKYIVKPNDYVEESFEPVEELFGFGNKYKKMNTDELEKERDKYVGIVGNTNQS